FFHSFAPSSKILHILKFLDLARLLTALTTILMQEFYNKSKEMIALESRFNVWRRSKGFFYIFEVADKLGTNSASDPFSKP
ncbi:MULTISPECIES: hypothetical protein, partial [Heyndrickxia]|uniref:hypothetical protein n=1 Tax=Heyndrickxia TaxID=2837504 RepID=UPI002E1FDB9B|nr:hypothetical protein [Weizmannia sp. CD-2023]